MFAIDQDTSWSAATATSNYVYASFPVDVIVYFHMQPSTFRFSCLPVSRVECMLQLPSLDIVFSSKRAEEELHRWVLKELHMWVLKELHMWVLKQLLRWVLKEVHRWVLKELHRWVLQKTCLWENKYSVVDMQRETATFTPNTDSTLDILVHKKIFYNFAWNYCSLLPFTGCTVIVKFST